MADMSDEDARALKRERVAAQIERFQRTKGIFAGIKFNAGPAHQPRCAEAAKLDGRLISEPPMLPLAGCDRPRCYCAWRGVTRWELERAAESKG